LKTEKVTLGSAALLLSSGSTSHYRRRRHEEVEEERREEGKECLASELKEDIALEDGSGNVDMELLIRRQLRRSVARLR